MGYDKDNFREYLEDDPRYVFREDLKGPRRTPLDLKEGWLIDEYDYPQVVKRANANGRSVEDIVTRPAGYVPYQSVKQPDGRYAYNPRDLYPRSANDERDMGRGAETWADRRFINLTPDTITQPRTVPLDVGLPRKAAPIQQGEMWRSDHRKHTPVQMINAQTHSSLPGSPSPQSLVPMSQYNQKPRPSNSEASPVIRRARTPRGSYPADRSGSRGIGRGRR